MQLEVPKDQYDNIVEGFRRKIESGKVDGVSDPSQAELIVRKGKLTYQQAVNLTKPGTIESLLYDAGTGAVVCTSTFGITFIATMFGTYKKLEIWKIYPIRCCCWNSSIRNLVCSARANNADFTYRPCGCDDYA